ncbi:hypothetical protein BBJ28_00018221 [Nothophytophthora sp. Chile5]|nr:hypothetical protein BBJ28_00018221 [Nothophytophthora sp. Chile5]
MGSAFLSALAIAAFSLDCVSAHGYISDPAASFLDASKKTSYVKTITADVSAAFQGQNWGWGGEAAVAAFTATFPSAGYASLRAMLDQHVSDCGNTRADVSPVDVAGKTSMKWQNDEEHVGFVASHHGPCEVWLDDTMVGRQSDCVAAYGSGYPASVNVDFSQCKHSCTLRFYWLALHDPNWQIYKQCVPLTNKATRTLRLT